MSYSNPQVCISRRTLWRCLLRSYFILTGVNTKGMQNIGFSFAIDPALQSLYPSPQELQKARLRYIYQFNCHPFLTPYVLGIFIHCEKSVVSGRLPVATYDTIRNTFMYTLSVIGDNLFSGGLYITLSLLVCITALAGNMYGALVVLGISLITLHGFKYWTFNMGLRHGLMSMQWLERLRLLSIAEKCKYINAVLLGVLFWQTSMVFLADGLYWIPVAALGLLVVFTGVQNRIHISRIAGSSVFIITIVLFTYFTFSLSQ